MARSLNKVILIGNLTRDPELRYTPSGAAVCTFGIATNRQWVTDGEKKEDVEFHKIVAWNKLGELCGQLLKKGRKVYVEGRLQTRKWQGQDGNERSSTEIVISDMLMLDSRGTGEEFSVPENIGEEIPDEFADIVDTKNDKPGKNSNEKKPESKKEEIDDDIPF